MSQQYIGEIRMFGAGTPPAGWLLCDGTSGLSIEKNPEYRPLYSVITTNYGGTGPTNFDLPDLRSRMPMGLGQGPGLSSRTFSTANAQLPSGGNETITMSEAQLPSHTHTFNVLNEANSKAALLSAHSATQAPAVKGKPSSLIVGYTEEVVELFAPDPNPANATAQILSSNLTPLSPNTISRSGNNSDINIMPPYLTVNFIIAYCGRYPKATAKS